MSIADASDAKLRRIRDKASPELQAKIDAELAARQAAQLSFADSARAMGQGLFGFGDEIEAGLRTGFGVVGDYTATRNQIRDDIEQAYSDNPVAMHGLEFATGMLVPGGALYKAAKGAKTVGNIIKSGAGVGAVDGAISGLGYSDELENSGGDIAAGLALGGATGGLLSGVVPGVAKMIRGQTNPDEMVRQAAARAGMRGEEVADRLDQLAPADGGANQGVLADVAPEFAGLATGAATKSPYSASLKTLADRKAGAAGRLTDEIEQRTGTTGATAPNLKTEIEAQRAADAFEDYAGLNGVVYRIGEVQSLLDDEIIGPQMKKALKAYASRNNMTVKEVLESGEIPASVIHRARSKAGNEAARLRAHGAGDDASDLEYVINSKLDPLLDDTVSGYAEARSNFRRTSQELEALQTGRDLGRSNRAVSEEEELLAAITDPRLRELTALGAQSQIANDIRANATKMGEVRNSLGSSPARQNLKLETADMKWLDDSLAREEQFSQTANLIDAKQGSQTALRQSAAEDFERYNAMMGALADPVTGGPVAAMMAGWRRFVGDKLNIKNEAVADAILNRLLKTGMTRKQVIELIDNPDGATELARLMQSGKLRAATGALTGLGLQGTGALYQE
jgi:hypothetical protein